MDQRRQRSSWPAEDTSSIVVDVDVTRDALSPTHRESPSSLASPFGGPSPLGPAATAGQEEDCGPLGGHQPRVYADVLTVPEATHGVVLLNREGAHAVPRRITASGAHGAVYTQGYDMARRGPPFAAVRLCPACLGELSGKDSLKGGRNVSRRAAKESRKSEGPCPVCGHPRRAAVVDGYLSVEGCIEALSAVGPATGNATASTPGSLSYNRSTDTNRGSNSNSNSNSNGSSVSGVEREGWQMHRLERRDDSVNRRLLKRAGPANEPSAISSSIVMTFNYREGQSPAGAHRSAAERPSAGSTAEQGTAVGETFLIGRDALRAFHRDLIVYGGGGGNGGEAEAPSSAALGGVRGEAADTSLSDSPAARPPDSAVVRAVLSAGEAREQLVKLVANGFLNERVRRRRWREHMAEEEKCAAVYGRGFYYRRCDGYDGADSDAVPLCTAAEEEEGEEGEGDGASIDCALRDLRCWEWEEPSREAPEGRADGGGLPPPPQWQQWQQQRGTGVGWVVINERRGADAVPMRGGGGSHCEDGVLLHEDLEEPPSPVSCGSLLRRRLSSASSFPPSMSSLLGPCAITGSLAPTHHGGSSTASYRRPSFFSTSDDLHRDRRWQSRYDSLPSYPKEEPSSSFFGLPVRGDSLGMALYRDTYYPSVYANGYLPHLQHRLSFGRQSRLTQYEI